MFGRSNGEPREYQFHLSIMRLKNYGEKKKKRDCLGGLWKT